MSFNNGDTVRFSKNGKVDYTVSEVNADGTLNLTGAKSNRKNVDPATLTLVTAARNAVHASEEVLNALLIPQSTLSDDELDAIAKHVENPNHDDTDAPMAEGENPVKAQQYPMPVWEVELSDAATDTKRPYLLTVDHVTTAHKSYGAACDALIIASREGIEHYAVIDHQGKRLATRTAA
jgi:hypothetical protein